MVPLFISSSQGSRPGLLPFALTGLRQSRSHGKGFPSEPLIQATTLACRPGFSPALADLWVGATFKSAHDPMMDYLQVGRLKLIQLNGQAQGGDSLEAV